jgi:hypothetical protein
MMAATSSAIHYRTVDVAGDSKLPNICCCMAVCAAR